MESTKLLGNHNFYIGEIDFMDSVLLQIKLWEKPFLEELQLGDTYSGGTNTHESSEGNFS